MHQTSDKTILLGKSIEEILNETWQYLIPFTMTDGNGLTKENVVKAVCRHYWMREIGLETVALWKYAIGTRLQEIMPKYQEMALAQAEMGSVWESQRITKTHTGEFSTSGSESGESTSSKSSTINETSSKDGTVSGEDGTVTTESGEVDNSKNGSSEKNDDHTVTVNYGKITADKATEWSDLHKEDIGTQENTEVANGNENSAVWHDALTESNSTTTGKDVNKFSDTPQNALTAVEEGMYLTNATIDDKTATNHGTNADHYNESIHQNTNTDTTSNISSNVRSTQNEGKNVDSTVTNSGNDTTTDRDTSNGTTSETGKETSVKDGSVNFNTQRTSEETGRNNQNVSENGSSTDSAQKNECGTDHYGEEWSGFQGDKVKTMAEYNELYVNIYQLIIGEVAGFFMSIF